MGEIGSEDRQRDRQRDQGRRRRAVIARSSRSSPTSAAWSRHARSLGKLNPFGTGGIIAAQGGATLGGGGRNVLVGERGPEVASLPSGTRITPLPPPALSGSQLLGGATRPVVTQVFLDRRQIAEAVGSFSADEQAAR